MRLEGETPPAPRRRESNLESVLERFRKTGIEAIGSKTGQLFVASSVYAEKEPAEDEHGVTLDLVSVVNEEVVEDAVEKTAVVEEEEDDEENGEDKGGQDEEADDEDEEDEAISKSSSSDDDEEKDATWEKSMVGKTDAQIRREQLAKKKAEAMAILEKEEIAFAKEFNNEPPKTKAGKAKMSQLSSMRDFLAHLNKLSPEAMKQMDYGETLS